MPTGGPYDGTVIDAKTKMRLLAVAATIEIEDSEKWQRG